MGSRVRVRLRRGDVGASSRFATKFLWLVAIADGSPALLRSLDVNTLDCAPPE